MGFSKNTNLYTYGWELVIGIIAIYLILIPCNVYNSSSEDQNIPFI